jgi:hypothetical protein
MAKYNVEEIKQEALLTKRKIKDKDYYEGAYLSVIEIRSELNKMLFLCREIEKLRKKEKNHGNQTKQNQTGKFQGD